MSTNKEFFKITSLSREDIASIGYKGAESISDSDMERIASKMADAYLENEFWIDLEIMVDMYLHLYKEKKSNE